MNFLTPKAALPTVALLSTFVQKTYPSTVHKSYPPMHEPVLLKECLEFLNLKPGSVVVDCTLGLAGHSSEFLKTIGPTGMLYGFDRDERNIEVALSRLKAVGSNFKVFHDSFSSLKDRLKGEGVSQVDALLFDLGLSSPHLDDPERGFSFQNKGPLDMRFDATSGSTASDLLQNLSERELADVFYQYGEVHSSRKLARAIVERRKTQRFETTDQLAELVEEITSGKVLAQVFQALRIAVNEELKALELGLNQAIELLAPHGRIVVLSYHSLEDRFVKHLFKQLSTDKVDPTDPFGRRVLRPKSLSLLNKKPIMASENEVAINPRARSAKLRAVEKLSL